MQGGSIPESVAGVNSSLGITFLKAHLVHLPDFTGLSDNCASLGAHREASCLGCDGLLVVRLVGA